MTPNDTALSFSDLASAQSRSNQIALSLGCDGVLTKYWHEQIALTDGTAVLTMRGYVGIPPGWTPSFTYQRGQSVLGSDGLAYVNILANNINRDPTTDGGVRWLGVPADYSATTSYTIGTRVLGPDGFIYLSRTGANKGNPLTDVVHWFNTGTTSTTAILFDDDFGAKHLTQAEIAALKSWSQIASLLPPPPTFP